MAVITEPASTLRPYVGVRLGAAPPDDEPDDDLFVERWLDMMPDPRTREMAHEELQPGYIPDDQRGYAAELHQRMLDFYPGDPIGRETLAVSSTAVTLVKLPAYARSALITVNTAAIRVTFDQTAPAATTGQHFGVAEHFTLSGRNTLLGVLFIRETGTDASIDVEYFD